LKLNGTHHSWFMLMMLVYWEKAYTIRKNANVLVVASKEVGLEVIAHNTGHVSRSVCRTKPEYKY